MAVQHAGVPRQVAEHADVLALVEEHPGFLALLDIDCEAEFVDAHLKRRSEFSEPAHQTANLEADPRYAGHFQKRLRDGLGVLRVEHAARLHGHDAIVAVRYESGQAVAFRVDPAVDRRIAEPLFAVTPGAVNARAQQGGVDGLVFQRQQAYGDAAGCLEEPSPEKAAAIGKHVHKVPVFRIRQRGELVPVGPAVSAQEPPVFFWFQCGCVRHGGLSLRRPARARRRAVLCFGFYCCLARISSMRAAAASRASRGVWRALRA